MKSMYVLYVEKNWFILSFSDVYPLRNCTHTMYKGVRSCPTKTYYTLTHGKINSHQLYLSLHKYIHIYMYVYAYVRIHVAHMYVHFESDNVSTRAESENTNYNLPSIATYLLQNYYKGGQVTKPVILVKICYTPLYVIQGVIDKVTSWLQLISKLLVAPTCCF